MVDWSYCGGFAVVCSYGFWRISAFAREGLFLGVVFVSARLFAGPGLFASGASVSVLLLMAKDWRNIFLSSSSWVFDSCCAWLKVFSRAVMRSICDLLVRSMFVVECDVS